MKKTLFLSILIFNILLSNFCFAFFVGFGTSGGVDTVIKNGQSKGIIPNTPYFKPTKTYWTKLESDTDIMSPQVGPSGIIVGAAPTTYETCQFGLGIRCDVANKGWRVNASSILNKYRGCIEFWYKPLYTMPSAVTYLVLGCADINNDFCNIYLQTVPPSYIRFGMRRSSIGDGWVSVECSPVWGGWEPLHFALVWDAAGFNVGGATYFQAFYLNGIFRAGSTDSNFNTNWMKNSINFGYSLDLLHHANGVIDNLKIYNYAKTNFSDRNTE